MSLADDAAGSELCHGSLWGYVTMTRVQSRPQQLRSHAAATVLELCGVWKQDAARVAC